MSILIFLIILVVLIVVHELGHFSIAKWARVAVDEFAVGFPPRLFARKWGETVYAVNALPIGGYVKIRGENGAEKNDPRSLASRPRLIQAAVLSGGVLCNALLGWAFISLGLMLGLPVSDTTVPEGYTLSHPMTVVTSVRADSPAAQSGMRGGDKIVSINTLRDPAIQDIQRIVKESSGGIEFVVIRAGTEKFVTVMPAGEVGEEKSIGIGLDRIGTLKLSISDAVVSGFSMTAHLAWATLSTLITIVQSLFSGTPAFDAVTGPVGLVSLVGTARDMGLIYLLSLTAIISVNLAIVNLLPFPALDGGRLLVLLIEGVTHRTLPERITGILHLTGLIILIALMVLITIRDIHNLF